jgi:catabolite regulation protein CreA
MNSQGDILADKWNSEPLNRVVIKNLKIMNKNIQYTRMWDNNRDHVLQYLHDQKFSRVIDIGASKNSWAFQYMSHYFDINKMDDDSGKIGL